MLNKEVLGFYPNWLASDLYLSLNYDSLTTIAWAFLGLNPDGSLSKHNYPPTNLINYAHSKGKKVVVSLNPGWGSPTIDTILSKSSLQNSVIDNLLTEVQQNNFDGVDIDFEGFPTINLINGKLNRTLFTQFIISLSSKFLSKNSNYRISVDVPAIDWNNVFDIKSMQSYVNYFTIMCYDYHWQSGPSAGAVSPLTSPDNQSVTNSIDNYLQITPASKLLLGVPYYGYEWQTGGNSQENAPTVGTGAVIYYGEALNKIVTYPRQWSSTWSSPYYLTLSGQGWYDDEVSLGLKYNLVNGKNLAGIGIWALGYDTPRTELNSLITNSFSSTGGVDGGGKSGCVPPCPDGYICQGNICVPTATPSPTPSITPSPTPSITPSPTPTATPSPTPTATPTPNPTPSITPSPISTCLECDLNTNYCIEGNCVPKNYINYVVIGFGALIFLSILKR